VCAARRAMLVAMILAVAAAPSAGAARGAGLYEPFPSPAAGPRAQRFVGELNVRVGEADLAHGTWLRYHGPVPPGAASARAGVETGGSPVGTIVVLAVVLAALAGVGARVRSRTSRPAGEAPSD
jgi:hypothetical protein